jgi:hypothetical protein
MAYSGPVRISDPNGVLLAIGEADLAPAEDRPTWDGSLRVLDGTGVARKALVVRLDFEDQRTLAQLIPDGTDGGFAVSRVVGLAPVPA